jgi:phenylacetic acid degradation operon negative regulatory protein
MTPNSACQTIVDEFRSRPTVRAGSLITTVFGDSIMPRGGTVWLGSLIRAMAEFGISERLVRTSVYRLGKDGWLRSQQAGRRSFYSLTDEGRARFAVATHRIYGEPAAGWDGSWCLVLLAGLDAAAKEMVRRESTWLGFGALSANVLAHPSPDHADLVVTLQRLGVEDGVVILEGRTVKSEQGMSKLVHAAWNLDDIDDRYQQFVRQFRPLYTAVKRRKNIDPKTAFVARTLLIQEYRKALLRDPQLPMELLPSGWHGTAAYQLCRNLYLSLYRSADDYLSATMETADGPLPPPANSYFERFGGLGSERADERMRAGNE